MNPDVGLLLRGMRWRLATSVLTVLTATVAVGVAVMGPLYLRTAGDSVVRSTVGTASIEARGATLLPAGGQAVSLADIERAERAVVDAGGAHRFYGAPITSIVTGVGLIGPGASPLRSQLFSRTGICGMLRLRAGKCDLAPGNVLISDRSAQELRVSLGAVIRAGVNGARPLHLRVSGIYAVPNLDLPYWWGNGSGYFPFGQTSGPMRIPEVDSLIASPATALPVPDVAAVEGQVPLTGEVGLGDEARLSAALARAVTANANAGIRVGSQLPSLLASADQQRHVMTTIVVIAALQLVLLAVWVLGTLLVRSSDARRSELRVARLRGFPPASLLWVTVAEPAFLCLLGLVLGLAVAWGVVVGARDVLLHPGTVVSADRWVIGALVLTVLAIAGALGVGMVRLLRAPGLSDRAAGTRAAGLRLADLADAILLVLSVVALVALGTSGALAGRSDPLASAAPGLIALGAAVIAVHVVLFVCRLGVSASVDTDRVATFLAVRHIVRRPGALGHARVLIIALCLACFAASAWSVARTNRRAVATFRVGTTMVADVTPRVASLEQAVDRVDPRGGFAMAAVAVSTASSTLLAVDASRLPVAAFWPSGISSSSIAAVRRALLPPTAPEIRVPAAPIRVNVSTKATSAAAGLHDLDLSAWLSNPKAGTTIIDLGTLHRGAWTYTASPTDVCPGGCRLAGIGIVPGPRRQPPTAGKIELDVRGISARSRVGAWTGVPADLFAGGWRSGTGGVGVRASSASGLILSIPASAAAAYAGATGAATPPMAAVADSPAVPPAAVTSEVASLNGAALAGGEVPTQGLDGNTLRVSTAVSSSALPGVGSNAVMVDLDLLSRVQVNPTAPFTTDQVWLGPAAPSNVLARLRSAGLQVDALQQASTVFAQAERSGPALADDFLLVATAAALLVAAASTLGALGTTTRQRATELTALEVAGVRRRVLVRALGVETAVLVATTLFGAGAGVIAAIMAVPSLPELAAPSVIPLHYGLPAGLVAGVSAAVVAVVAAASAAMALIVVRRMSPSLLRTAGDGLTR
jgi:putative ABC transport system permease protein